MDKDGIIPEQLETMISSLESQGRKPKFVYVIPDFQNPSGINLSLERRREVLAIAARHDLLVIEDSPYRELRFEGDLLPSLYTLDTDKRVVQMKTFSKIFSPGFRIGWISAPREVIDKIIMAKQGTDLCTSAFTSMIAAYLMKDGFLEKQIEISKELYARKAKAMLTAMDKYMPKLDDLWWSKPDGGMFLWLHLPEYMDTMEMIEDAIKLKVAYVVGSCFYTDGSGRNEMRLNYSFPSEEQIDLGIQRIFVQAADGSGKTNWLVEISQEGLKASPLGPSTPPASFSSIHDFRTWLKKRNRASDHFVLFVKEGGTSRFSQVSGLLEQEGYTKGFDVLQASDHIIDDTTGAGIP